MLDQLTMLADMSPRPHTMSPSHGLLQDAVLSIVPPRERIHMELSEWNGVSFTACFKYSATFRVIYMKWYIISCSHRHYATYEHVSNRDIYVKEVYFYSSSEYSATHW